MPEMALPALDFDFAGLQIDMAEYKDSQQSMLSPQTRARSGSSVSDHSLLGIDIPSSGVGSYQLPFNDLFQISSAQKAPMGHLFEGEEELLLDDFDFEFDGEGKIRDINEEERQVLRSGSIIPHLGRLESDSAANDRVHREHEEAVAGLAQGAEFDADGDFIMQVDDDLNALPEADPFSPKVASGRPRRNSDLSASPQVESSSDTAEAQLKAPRKRRPAKRIESDHKMELLNADLARWNREYLENMQVARDQKQKKNNAAQAKANAKAWVFGNGIGNIGQGIGRSHIPSPLDVFAGEGLMAAITGTVTPSRDLKRRRGNDEEDDMNDGRNVRPRPEIDEDNLGRNLNVEDDLMFNNFDDSNQEIGRDAPGGLDDHPSSAMPWNVSASLHSFRTHGPGSFGGRGSSIPGGRPHSRLTSASPLLGRGSALGVPLPEIERLDEGTDDNFPAVDNRGYSPSVELFRGRGRTLTPSGAGDLISEKDFEMFGPVAAIDTQTANQSQWVKEALAREAMNFFDFVKNTIIEGDIDAGEEDAEMGGFEKELGSGQVSFEMLFPPENNTAMVASQAFHHVLTLATKRLLGVQQEELWSDIMIHIL